MRVRAGTGRGVLLRLRASKGGPARTLKKRPRRPARHLRADYCLTAPKPVPYPPLAFSSVSWGAAASLFVSPPQAPSSARLGYVKCT